jgi:cellulose synthase (UDP-forming)
VSDPRLDPVHWPLPGERSSRRRAALMGLIAGLLAVWYLSWLLDGERIGAPVLFGLLVAAESFNLFQAIGFWWTCRHQRVRRFRPSFHAFAEVDVMIPCYDEPVEVIEPTVAAAVRLRNADARVWVLDDGGREEIREVAARHGAGYIARTEHDGAKAGNINNALQLTDAPYVAVLDCDHVPHPDFLERTLGHLGDFGVGFVQTPQYYANAGAGPVAEAAASQQNLFFGPIARGKDGLDAIFCCGTNVVFRRRALEEAGGFPTESVTEDFQLSVRLNEMGWRGVYVPEVLASGLGPEDMASYVSQQQRWARGCLSAIPAVLRARIPWRLRLQYLLSSTYFLTGWTLVVYMSLPVIRILTGEQPLAAATADQFLLHFAPYYCAALATVALAGSGTYTFNAFALAAGSFWIHIQATLTGLLRRPARFVVTPKEGTEERQPRAVAPALVAIAVLVGAGVYGLLQDTGAATLNNVAFAGLHAAVLTAAVMPALRRRSSAPLEPAPAGPPPAARRRWPRPVVGIAVLTALLVPVAVAAVGSRELENRVTLSEQARVSAQAFLDRYVDDTGRAVRLDEGGDTVSEGQAYALLLSVAVGDRDRFQQVFEWTENNLRRDDGLLASHWDRNRIVDRQPATDADLDAARALILAGNRFDSEEYAGRGLELAQAVLTHETASFGDAPVLTAGPWGRAPAIANPSYFSPRAYDELAAASEDGRWDDLAATSRTLLEQLTAGGGLPPDWATVSLGESAPGEPLGLVASPIASPAGPGAAGEPASGLDAVRTPVRLAESCIPSDRELAATLWPLYERNPGRSAYTLGGGPRDAHAHAASFVGAAGAADAAGEVERSAALLDRAEAWDERHPTYYGSAWVALGRVMLSSEALGNCSG